jgi:hypothetical protein
MSAIDHFLAGALAGVAATGISHPVDAIMVLRVRGMALGEILSNPMQLGRGWTMSIVESGMFNGFNFGIYELIKAFVEKATGQPLSASAFRNILAASASSSMCQFISCPQKRIQYRMQSGDGKMGIVDHAAAIYKEGGAWGFWEGISSCLATVPDLAFAFYIFDFLKLWWQLRTKRAIELFTPMESFLLGVVAKATSVSIVYPTRFAKITAQSQSIEDKERNGGTVTGIWREALEKKGVFGLYEGLYADITAASMRNALKFLFKDRFFFLLTSLRR